MKAVPFQTAADRWTDFWFRAEAADRLVIIRLVIGVSLIYSHLIWALDFDHFFSVDGWLPVEDTRWNLFWYLESSLAHWILYFVTLLAYVMMTLGFFTRLATCASWFFTLMFFHRLAGASFGLDEQILSLLFCLMINPGQGNTESVSANIAIRLIQVKLCLLYLTNGVGKLAGESWWSGSALWRMLASYDYQMLDATFFAGYPWLLISCSCGVLILEVFYGLGVWFAKTRYLVVGSTMLMHVGIGLLMGMPVFALVMVAANFVWFDLRKKL